MTIKQKKFLFTGLLSLFAAFAAQLFAKERIPGVDAKTADSLVRSSQAVLLDVREKTELDSTGGVARGALWFSTKQALAGGADWEKFQKSLPKDKTIITYCVAGVRAAKIAARLEQAGFKVANMGGIRDWQAAGLPLGPPTESTQN